MDIQTVILWVLMMLFTLPGFFFGYKKLIADDSKIEHFQRLGIAIPLMRLLGAAEIASSLALFYPPTRLYGMIAWLVILLGANFYNFTKKEPREEQYASVGVLVLWGVIWWIM